MATYVDDAEIMWRGKYRYHMTSDSVEELHAFAKLASINKCWFDPKAKNKHPHYDITGEQRARAIALGAIEVSREEMVGLAKRLIPKKPVQTSILF